MQRAPTKNAKYVDKQKGWRLFLGRRELRYEQNIAVKMFLADGAPQLETFPVSLEYHLWYTSLSSTYTQAMASFIGSTDS